MYSLDFLIKFRFYDKKLGLFFEWETWLLCLSSVRILHKASGKWNPVRFSPQFREAFLSNEELALLMVCPSNLCKFSVIMWRSFWWCYVSINDSFFSFSTIISQHIVSMGSRYKFLKHSIAENLGWDWREQWRERGDITTDRARMLASL
jgi:hypothetical protein